MTRAGDEYKDGAKPWTEITLDFRPVMESWLPCRRKLQPAQVPAPAADQITPTPKPSEEDLARMSNAISDALCWISGYMAGGGDYAMKGSLEELGKAKEFIERSL